MPRNKKDTLQDGVQTKSPTKGNKTKQTSIDDYVQLKQKKIKLEDEQQQQQQQPEYVIQEVEEVTEFICGKCESSFDDIESLRQHLPLCKTRTLNEALAERPEPMEMTHVVLDLNPSLNDAQNSSITENTPVVFETDFDVDIGELEFYESHNNSENCFCCDEPFETAHAGHIRCEHCVKTFKSNASLRRHNVIIHSKYADAIECPQCPAMVATPRLMEMHEDSHKSGKPFSCKSCGKDFTRRYHLERHMKYMNCDGSRPVIKYPCKVCSMTFARMDNLRDHLKSHIEPVEKSKDFQCPHCEKAFVGSSLLNIHIRTHTGERQVLCIVMRFLNTCTKRYFYNISRPFQCDLCNNFFPR